MSKKDCSGKLSGFIANRKRFGLAGDSVKCPLKPHIAFIDGPVLVTVDLVPNLLQERSKPSIYLLSSSLKLRGE